MLQLKNGEQEESYIHPDGVKNNDKISNELLDIFECICSNENILVKSQQINDPDLTHQEKLRVLQDIFNCNALKFLQSFGRFLNEQQLNDFELELEHRRSIIETDKHREDIAILMANYRHRLLTRAISVKNRRYSYFKKLIQKGEYFSEHEMMQRAPELYQDMVGKYLSDTERNLRDAYDVRKTSFSGILMHTLEQQQRDDLLKKAEEHQVLAAINADIKNLRTTHAAEHQIAHGGDEVPSCYRQRWGCFNNEEVACTTTNTSINRTKIHEAATCDVVTQSEREFLRNEFLSLMQEQFLAGKDKDFDYSAVDENSQFDDLQQYNQDQEDKYFDESEEEACNSNEYLKKKLMSEESEDELDIFMKEMKCRQNVQNKS